MCESLSGASRDRTQHYAPDGTTPITHLTRYHLACLRSIFAIFDRLTSNGYQGIIHSENPQAGFLKLPDVQRLAHNRAGAYYNTLTTAATHAS